MSDIFSNHLLTSRHALILGLLLAVLGSISASLIQSDLGDVEVTDITIAAHNGETISALMYLPPNATEKTPAPAVINVHGYVNQKEVMSNFSIEFARRGYVVIAMDMSGHGGTGVIENDGSRGVSDVLKYAHTLPFVDSNHIGLVGHSMGGWSSVTAAVNHPELVRTLIVAGSAQGGHEVEFMLGAPTVSDDANFNFGVEFGKYDEFVAINYFDQERAVDFVESHWLMAPFGASEPVILDRVYGDFASGTGRMATQSPETHAGVHQSSVAIANVLKMMNLSSPAPVDRDESNQIWPYKEVATSIAYLGLLLFMFGLVAQLFRTSMFQKLVQPMPTTQPMHPTLYLGFAGLIIAAVALLMVPLQMTAMHVFGANSLFPMLFANTSILFFGTVQLIFLALFVAYRVIRRSESSNFWVTHGLSTNSATAEFDWRYIGRAFGLSFLVVAAGYLLVATVYQALNVDMRWWMLLIRPMEPHRFLSALIYLIPFTAIFLVNGLLAFGWLRLRDFGGGIQTSVIWSSALFFVNASGIAIIIGIQMFSLYTYGKPYFGEVGYDTLMVILGNGFIPLLAVTSIVSTLCFRKTGNIYTGAFLSGMLATWMIACYQPY